MAKEKTVKYRESNHDWYEANKARILLRNRDLYKKNKETINAKHREYYRNNKSKLNRQSTESHHRNRRKFLEMYGNKCVCCGESEERFLALDHVNGQRNRNGKPRESSSNAYRNSVKLYDTKKYTILCHNCNFAERYGEPCPHKLKIKN